MTDPSSARVRQTLHGRGDGRRVKREDHPERRWFFNSPANARACPAGRSKPSSAPVGEEISRHSAEAYEQTSQLRRSHCDIPALRRENLDALGKADVPLRMNHQRRSLSRIRRDTRGRARVLRAFQGRGFDSPFNCEGATDASSAQALRTPQLRGMTDASSARITPKDGRLQFPRERGGLLGWAVQA